MDPEQGSRELIESPAAHDRVHALECEQRAAEAVKVVWVYDTAVGCAYYNIEIYSGAVPRVGVASNEYRTVLGRLPDCDWSGGRAGGTVGSHEAGTGEFPLPEQLPEFHPALAALALVYIYGMSVPACRVFSMCGRSAYCSLA